MFEISVGDEIVIRRPGGLRFSGRVTSVYRSQSYAGAPIEWGLEIDDYQYGYIHWRQWADKGKIWKVNGQDVAKK